MDGADRRGLLMSSCCVLRIATQHAARINDGRLL
jgi:hypothetical protein